MKVKQIFDSKFARLLKVEAITIYPFIFFSKPQNEVLKHTIRHELIHTKQVEQVGWFRFYLSYLLYYLAERVQGRDHDAAYYRIPYEREAYEHQHDQ